MNCPYRQTLDRFGVRAQLLKLREECLELAEAIDFMELVLGTKGRQVGPALTQVCDEAGDVLNVLRSIMTATPAIEQCAATKMLRTQIRMKTGYYEDGSDG